jgi:hypothetical protein
MPVIANIDGGFYKFVLVLHILCAIVGFGAVFLNGVYGNEVRNRKGPEGLAIFQANFKVGNVAEWFIYAVPILGLGLVGMSKTGGIQVWKFSQTWVWLAIVIYLAAIGTVHGVLRPRLRRMETLMGELNAGAGPGAGGPPPQAVALEATGKQVGIIGASLDLAVVVILYLMVFKPGL